MAFCCRKPLFWMQMAGVDKAKLRTVFLRKRKMLSSQQCATISSKITDQFARFILDRSLGNVHLFLPIEKQNEVNTWGLIDVIQNKGASSVISKSDLVDNKLTHYLYEGKQLIENKWGIPEPINGDEVAVKDIDMVLVPLVVFDRKGHRVGYGKGYYDRFLSECRPDCLKVGLSMSPPIDIIPYTDPYDIALDYCITPLKIYKF